jgi:hypothetical protein
MMDGGWMAESSMLTEFQGKGNNKIPYWTSREMRTKQNKKVLRKILVLVMLITMYAVFQLH